ncbi:MAG TPA: hypothetical protein VLX32_07505 [Candidatus Acidoferrum sp.]|nr:hypothetical protein [Candidatus Acidoferrum sp.]
MRRLIVTLAVATALTTPVVMGGCAVRARYYDTDHHDYHRWDHHEDRFYLQWESETHRDHRNFRDRDQREQQEYWNWRHQHEQNQH